MRSFRMILVPIIVLISASPASASSPWLIPPVDAPLARVFEAPFSQWGSGHRGIDYDVPVGTAVRAVADGTVSFAGDVAATRAVTIVHAGGIESTYSDLSEVLVSEGDVVEQGFWIGRTGRAHPSVAGFHLGVKVEGDYVDPQTLMGPIDTSSAIRLAPLVWEPPDTLPALFREPLLSARAVPTCEPVGEVAGGRPNDNIAVLVAGIGSKTEGGVSAALYESGGRILGYRERDTYAFSYRDSTGPDLHEPYSRADTFGDIRLAARRLRSLVLRIAARHPGRSVDLIAHSQGGIVARTFLQMTADAWEPGLPQIDHLVTFSSPHGGAPLAAGVPVLDSTPFGRAALEAASWWAKNSGPLPDPYATSVQQLAPGSELLERLDEEATLYGTRVLSLAIPNDVVVPADRARWDAYEGRVVPPEGLNGHDAVVTSRTAVAIASSFLRGAGPTCLSGWDRWGPRIGSAIGLVERAVPWLIGR